MTDTTTTVVELRTGPIAPGGGCVARTDEGQVVFVRHALPGETVLARVTETTTSYLRADAIEIVERSPHRVPPPCPSAGPGRCGGCDWQHVALAEQRRLKAVLVAEQLRRLAGLDRTVDVEEVPGAPDGLGWRTRVRFAVDNEGHLGLRRHRSHALELLTRCPIAAPSVERIGAEESLWRGAASVEVFAPAGADPDEGRLDGAERDHSLATGSPGVVVVGAPRRSLGPIDLPKLAGTRTGVVLRGRTVREPRRLRVEVLGHSYRITAGAFWQVHRGAPALLASTVLEGLGPREGEHAVDLYAGVGLFTVLLAEGVGRGGSVVAVERDPRASSDARHNTARQDQVQVRTEGVTPRLLQGLGPIDLVVMDPPREGVGRALMAALVELRPAPRRVAYVACDPASFARDLRVALDAGWTLSTLRAFDQFPMTEHVELVAFLEPPAAESPGV